MCNFLKLHSYTLFPAKWNCFTPLFSLNKGGLRVDADEIRLTEHFKSVYPRICFAAFDQLSPIRSFRISPCPGANLMIYDYKN